jgi:hypothetical protein
MATMGHATKVGIAAAAPSTLQLEFESCGVGQQGSHVQSPGIRDGRSYHSESVVDGPYTVGGPLVMAPRPDELDALLPYILGAAEIADVFALAETIPDFVLDVEKVADSGTTGYRYSGCKMNSATFRSAAGGLLMLEMDVQGKDEAEISFPAIGGTLTVLQPYIHHQLVLTIGGQAYQPSTIDITINNALILDRFLNSQTRTELPESDRIVTCNFTVPYDANARNNLYGASVAGLAATAKWTNGNRSILFTFGVLQFPKPPIVIPGRTGELMATFAAQARMLSATRELVVTNDSTG